MENLEHKSEPASLESLRNMGATVERDRFGANAYIAQFNLNEGKTIITLRILFNDATGSDIVITNMTTLPNPGEGFGTEAVQKVLEWARGNGFKEIRATQVGDQSEGFWVKNGFFKEEGANPTNDFIYKLENN